MRSKLIIILTFPSLFYSQNRDKKPDSSNAVIEKVIKETKIVKDSANADKIISYSTLIKGGVTKKGLFTVHKVKDEIYFEIPKNLLGKDILIVNKISAVPSQINEAGINRGMNYENKIIRFYKDAANKKIRVKTFDPKIYASETDNIYESVKNNFVESVIESFDIKTYGPDSAAVFKVNNIFNGESKSFNNVFDNIGMGSSVRTKDSYIEDVKTFPENVVVKSMLTTQISEGKTSKEKADLTVQTTTNLVLLPEPMVGRYADPRIGYFTVKKQYFSDLQQSVKDKELITRWRLEPKPEDREKYLKGELVEPKKPIVYYIDPATPKQWQQAIINGVNDWNKAFEQAGFKNVISAKMPDKNDINFDPDDVRYNVITYAASAMANAMGPSVVDPRTGEILESDIIWWHNVMSLLQSWMRVQTGIIDPEVRNNDFPDSKMAHAIRFVSSHEVGHTFGLKHNMGSSFAYDVESLRSPEFTSKMGGTAPSIMDYARFNYIAQPWDNVKVITPEIGVYDKFAIEWGYRWTGKKSPEEELLITKKWIEKHANDPLYFYGEQQEEAIDPRSQAEDLGNDAMKAGEYGIANLKRTVSKIIEWTTKNGEDYDNANSLYNQLINQWYVYNNHVLANIGGIYINPTVKGDGMKTFSSVPYTVQKSALDFLIRNMLTMPEWLFINELSPLIKPAKNTPTGLVSQSVYNVFREKQAAVLYGLLNDKKILRLLDNEFTKEEERTGVKMMTPLELFDTLRGFIFNSSRRGKTLSISERMTQKNYIDALIIDVNNNYEKTEKNTLKMPMLCDYAANELYHNHYAFSNENNLTMYFEGMKRLSEVGSIKRAELIKVLKIIERAQKSGDQSTKDHYSDMLIRLKKALNTN